ncbi:di-heme oxidoredictase family protein, partial [Rhizobacter sp. OV335]|uniref:di-heme oxidoredictase family protein n=1 Tax=Rhizobacter sp. OV335 TaxID=1500264 RepID=UPI00090ED808
ILVSDDGATWYQLRYVADGKGGTEEFYNLNANVRYVRINGVKRASGYGYSIIEASFKSPGSDNTLGSAVTASVFPHPANGSNLIPAAAQQPPIDTIQFSLPDGTLVTRVGFVGRSRHARERGEDWNEAGYGANETVDAAGNPVDKGPGAHLNFVANYFAFRTWGVEFIDNSKVTGVTKPKVIVNEYFQQPQYGGGHSFVRGFDNPNTTGFGWMSPGDLLDDNTYTLGGQGIAACPVVPKPPQNALANPTSGYNNIIGANDGCSVVFDSFPGHSALSTDVNGVLARSADVPGATQFYDYAVSFDPATDKVTTATPVAGKSVAARSLKTGDVVEFSPSFFSTTAIMRGLGTTDGHRYYTNELSYVVGAGLRPYYGAQPRLNNTPLPSAALQGGLGSVSYDYADNSTFVFQQPHNNIGMQNMQRFVEGRRWFHTHMQTGDHTENGNDRNTAAVGLQGPMFNQSTCFGCHINNGRSLAPTVVNQKIDTMAVRTAQTDANGQQLPHPMYGLGAQMNAKASTDGVRRDWGTGVHVSKFELKTVTLADGSSVELSKPVVGFDGPTPDVFSVRSAQPVIGMGLLEAIPDADIIARARTTPDADGVMGVANFAYDPETNKVRLGRYGWKASKVSLRHQASAAALLDMSVTSPVYPNRDCLYGPSKCTTANRVDTGLTEDALKLLERYVALLAVPAQRSVASGYPKGVTPLAALNPDVNKITAGETVFNTLKCQSCHVQSMTTGSTSEFQEARNQKIKPYTDMLLHDMGADLGDGLTEGLATGSMWRTSPLWGIGYTELVAGKTIKVGYLHDSRARTLTEAIVWHGGEGKASRDRFVALSKADREALLAFLGSL